MDLIQAFLITSGKKDLAQDYFLKFSFWKKYILEAIEEMGGPEIGPELNVNVIAESDDVKKLENIAWQTAKKQEKIERKNNPVNPYDSSKKRSEEINGIKIKLPFGFQIKENEVFGYEQLKKEVGFRENFMSDKDFDKIDRELKKEITLKGNQFEGIDFFLKRRILANILNCIGTKEGPIDVTGLIPVEEFKVKDSDLLHKIAINKYFDLVGKNKIYSRFGHMSLHIYKVYLEPTRRFIDFIENRDGKKLNYVPGLNHEMVLL